MSRRMWSVATANETIDDGDDCDNGGIMTAEIRRTLLGPTFVMMDVCGGFQLDCPAHQTLRGVIHPGLSQQVHYLIEPMCNLVADRLLN